MANKTPAGKSQQRAGTGKNIAGVPNFTPALWRKRETVIGAIRKGLDTLQQLDTQATARGGTMTAGKT